MSDYYERSKDVAQAILEAQSIIREHREHALCTSTSNHKTRVGPKTLRRLK